MAFFARSPAQGGFIIMIRMLWIISAFTLVASALVTTALATAPGNQQDLNKGTAHVGTNPGTPDFREGGETIDDALVISALPFSDTGNTCDNLDNYDEACPYTGSTSPDVVYAFTPMVDMLIDIDLCASQYDTKVFVYCESPGNLTACNDDACANEYTPYASRLDAVPLFVGFTYYIIVDGYGGDCGYYILDILETNMCVVECPPEGFPEGEPPLEDFYEDNYNGGCGSTPPVFQNLFSISDECITVCGRSGWYWNDGDYRDTDWFEIVSTGYGVSFTAVGEYPLLMLVLIADCENLVILDSLEIAACVEGTINIPTEPYQVFWLWIGPQTFSGPVTEFDYVMEVCGITDWPIPVEANSWGGVKNLYR
jgi:hypothetical protein